MTEAIRSIREWIASLKMPTEPVKSPAANFAGIKHEFEAIETTVARVFFSNDHRQSSAVPTLSESHLPNQSVDRWHASTRGSDRTVRLPGSGRR